MYLKEHWFPALLKSQDDHLLAEGFANISLESQWVEFHHQFVPLLPLDSIAKICRINQEQETHHLMGKVYLSSPTFLRIVEVDKPLLEDATTEVLRSVSVKASISPAGETHGFLSHPPRRFSRLEVDVFSISSHQLYFLSAMPFQEEEQFLMDFVPPPLTSKKIVIAVTQVLPLGAQTICRCTILQLSNAAREELSNYLHQHPPTAQEDAFPPLP